MPERARLSRPRSTHSYASAVFAMGLLPRRGAQSVPGVADLMVVDLGRIVRSIEAERLDVEAPDGAEQRIGGDHAVPLGADQPRAAVRSCCELSTSSVVRWPACASFCTPASATLA